MERLHEFQHLLYQEFDGFNKKQEEFYAKELEEFLRTEQEELDGLKSVFESAEEAKNDWIATDERLRAEL